MRRGWRFWALIALIGVAVAVVALTLFGPVERFHEPSPNDGKNYTWADLQPTITYLEAHAEEVPDGLWLYPAPGSTVRPSEEMCVAIVYLLCEDESALLSATRDGRYCGGFNTSPYLDGVAVTPSSDSLLLDMLVVEGASPGDRFSDEHLCFQRPLIPGKHLFQIQAYPHGRKVWYSWVWTVEP